MTLSGTDNTVRVKEDKGTTKKLSPIASREDMSTEENVCCSADPAIDLQKLKEELREEMKAYVDQATKKN